MHGLKNRLEEYSKHTRSLVKRDVFFAGFVVAIWHALLIAFGYTIDISQLPTSGLFDTIPNTLLGHTLRWDSGWYMEIINSNFYQNTSSQGAIFAFYPLYPLLVGAMSSLSLGLLDPPIASLIINTIASFFILLALVRITKILTANTRLSYLAPLIFIASPAAFFCMCFTVKRYLSL